MIVPIEIIEILREGIWTLPGLCLFLVAWQGFSRPPTNRASTTFALFYFGMFIYFCLALGIWAFAFLMLKTVGVGGLVIRNIQFKGSENVSDFIVALVAALLVVVAPRFKNIKDLDVAARQFCLQLAAVPRLADQLAAELAYRTDFHVANGRLKAQISKLISDNIGKSALNFKNDGSPASRFTRAVSLYCIFVAPYNNGTQLEFPTASIGKSYYGRVMQLERKTLSQANSRYEILMETGLAYFGATRPIRQLEESLRQVAQETSNFVCRLIAHYVLLLEKTPTQRRKRLSSIGFDASEDLLPAFGLDQSVASIFAITIITLTLIAVVPRANPIESSDAFLIAAIFAFQIGLSILAGTFVARRFLERNEGVEVGFPPLYELSWAALIVVTLSATLKIFAPVIFALFSNGSFQRSLDDFRHNRWPSMLFPFCSTLSIGLMCIYFTLRKWTRFRLSIAGGICNGLVFTAAAWLVGLLLPPKVLSDLSPDLETAKLKIMLISGIIGVAVGTMVLAMFWKTQRGVRTEVSAPEPLSLDEMERNPANAQWADTALGSYLYTNVTGLEGRYVCFRPTFANPDVINAYLLKIHWDEKQSCLIFQEEARADSAYTQKGKITVPEGKPFINLITMDRGDVRLITVSRPDNQGIARGLILTLSNPRGMHFTPACTPVIIKRLGEHVPQLGFVHPGTPDYELYKSLLLAVVPNFGIVGQLPAIE